MKSKLTAICVAVLFLTPVLAFSSEPGETAAEKEVEAEIEALLGEDEEAARRAHQSLLERGLEAAPRLRSRLDEAEGEAAVRLIFILSRVRDPGSAEVLKKTWEESDRTDVRLAAAMALCRLDVEFDRFLNFIAGYVQEGDEEVRLEAMQMLGYIGDARVVPLLSRIFYDERQTDFVRQAALWDLAHTPVPESVYALTEMVADPEIDWFYKEIILTALRHLAQEEDLVNVITEELERIQRLPVRRAPSDQ